jgi:hypothetical protein
MLAGYLILLCTVVRIVPHPPNFAPVGASAVLAGRTMRPLTAIAVTLAAMALSDLALAWIHGWRPFGPVTLFVYGGFAAQVLIARGLRRVRGGAVAAAALGGTVFFALSNLGVWLVGAMYPHTAAGLAACYVAALPFYAATLVGDVAWTIVLVLAWQAGARRWFPAEAEAA